MTPEIEEGVRVFALEGADETRVYTYGVGTYVGDRLPPGRSETPDEEDAKAIRQALEEEDNAEVPGVYALVDQAVAQGQMTEEEAALVRERALQLRELEKAQPMEERIQAVYTTAMVNPCIELDSGTVVWGMQCWWGPIENYAKVVGERELVVVEPTPLVLS